MNYIKKYWFLVAMVLLLGYCTNELVQSNIKDANKEKIRKEVKLQIEKNLIEAIRSNNANYMWIKTLHKPKDSQKIYTYEVEREWLGERPIFFPGYIKDIITKNDENYGLKLNYLKFPFFSLSLELSCKKTMVDSFLTENPTVKSQNPDKSGVAVIANIVKITIDDDGNPVGLGSCIELLKDTGIRKYQLINFD